MTCELDGLQKLRSSYIPHLPLALQGLWVKVIRGDSTSTTDPTDALALNRSLPLTYGQPLIHLLPDTHDQRSFDHPELRVGIVFCGRQSPGGHNIVSGLFDALKAHNRKSVLLGFVANFNGSMFQRILDGTVGNLLKDLPMAVSTWSLFFPRPSWNPGNSLHTGSGTEGLFAQNSVEITEDLLMPYRNQGGFDLLGRTKDQIKSTQQVNDAKAACEELKLHALVLIGGCTSCTDAAHLAEAFVASGCQTKVLTAPVTLNGDLKNEFVEANVGFDTVCKVNSQLISNICTDALSAGKYYYFIRLMGRQASQVALECALQSHPNLVVIAEEVSSYKMTLYDVTMRICDVVQERAEKDKYHGVILLPEGLIESIPEVYALIQEIQDQMKCGVNAEDIPAQLSPWASALFEFLPPYIRKEFMLETESDNSAQLSQIETEKLFAQLVETEMKRRMKEGRYKQKKFDVICHFFGYQARGSLPSIFDCDYAYALGQICYHLVAEGLNGYMATLTNLKHSVSQWHCGAAPLTAMMSVTKWLRGPGIHNSRIGKPALHPASVDLKGKAYRLLHENASSWLMDDLYTNPGPIQYNGPGSDSRTISLTLEDQDYIGQIREIGTYLDKIKDLVKPGCPEEVLKAALVSLASATQILSLMS